MPMLNNDLIQLYRKLKKGDVSKVASLAGVSRQSVWLVAQGKFRNDLVIEAIKKIAQKRKEEQEKKLRKLEQSL